MSDNSEIIPSANFFGDIQLYVEVRINDPAAFRAANVVMLVGVSIKSLQRTAGVQFLNCTAFGKNLKIPVDRTQAYPGKALANHFIQLVGTGMGVHPAQFFQNDLALPGHSNI
jgi:hypothetical protein